MLLGLVFGGLVCGLKVSTWVNVVLGFRFWVYLLYRYYLHVDTGVLACEFTLLIFCLGKGVLLAVYFVCLK